MHRGDVWWVNFEPAIGGEVKKKRPSVIVSNDAANKHLNRLQVIPLTSNVEKLYPSEAYVTVNGKKHKAMADQLVTVSKSRLINQMGTVPPNDLNKIEQAIKTQLGMN